MVGPMTERNKIQSKPAVDKTELKKYPTQNLDRAPIDQQKPHPERKGYFDLSEPSDTMPFQTSQF